VAAQGVRYTLSPAAEYLQWKNDLGLPDATLYGARFGLGFGRLASVEAHYSMRNDLMLTEAGPTPDAPFDMRTMGADLQLHFGAGGFEPYAIGGAGITRFITDTDEQIDRVTFRYGGGIRFGLTDRLKANLWYTESRMNGDANGVVARIGGVVPGSLPEATSEKYRSFGASLGYAIGGSGSDEANATGWSFASIPIEPFVGRLRFEDEASPTTYMVGARAGIDVGSYFGLRGYYWHGVTDGFDDTTPIKSYGLEAQMNFTASLGPAPYLILGVGRVDYGDDYRNTADQPVADQNALIVGAGLGVRVSDKLRFNAAIRDYVLSGTDLEDVASTDQLTHNVLLSAGLTFNLGRSRSATAATPAHDRMMAPMARTMADTVRAVPGTGMITLPAPVNGELYVRYGNADSLRPGGMPGGIDAARLRLMIREIVREELGRITRADSASPVASQEELVDQIVARLDARAEPTPARADSLTRRVIEEMIAERVAAEVARQTPAPAPAPQAVPVGVPVVMQPVVGTPSTTRKFSAPGLYGGLALNSPVQVVVGGRFDYGSLFGMENLRFVPEAAVGFGAGSSFLVAGNAEMRFGSFMVSGTKLYPRARLGLGLLHVSDDSKRDGLDVVVNLTYGVVIPRSGTRPAITLEHQALDLFDFNRLLVGLQWGF
jgi:opacity protein-like surface antigen